jgi:hypothetical protein
MLATILFRSCLSFHLLSKKLKSEVYKTITFHVVLHVCETWSCTLREEHTLRLFENMVLRIFLPKREKVAEGWRSLHNEELHNLYVSPSHEVKVNEMGSTCSSHGRDEKFI